MRYRKRIFPVILVLFFLMIACQFFSIKIVAQPIIVTATAHFTPIVKPTQITRYAIQPPPFPLIQLAWFSKPPSGVSSLDFIANNFNFFILTKLDETERDYLRAYGKGIDPLQYILSEGIENPGSCSAQPYHNQVADEVGDFCNISQQYPGWFLLDRFGQRIIMGNTVTMDPGNQGWQTYFMNWIRQSHENLGWNGVFLDNVGVSLNIITKQSNGPVSYVDDASYQSAVEGFLKFLYTNYFQPQKLLLMANIISLDDPKVFLRYLNFLDGAMIEAFAVDWQNGYLSIDEWEQQMEMFTQAQSMGKWVILVAQGKHLDLNRQQFSFASYLLINKGKATFRYAHSAAYNEIWFYDNYGVNLGLPLGPRYQEGNFWRRDFANGFVLVDPQNHTSQIELNK